MSKRRHKEQNLNVKNPFALKVNPLSTIKKPKSSTAVTADSVDIDDASGKNDEFCSDVKEVQQIKEEPNFNLYVGTELGVLKGLCFGGELPISKNIFRADSLKSKSPSVKTLTWGDDVEKELLVTFSNHVVKTYNTKLRCFTRQTPLKLEPEDVDLVGLCCNDPENYVYGLENGTLGMWNLLDSKVTTQIKAGNSLCKVRQCPSHRNFYATGGNESDMKIWDLSSEKPDIPFFKAKNVPHDELDLRQPVWVQDLTFLPRTNEIVAVGTRYGHVRLYDVRAGLRPVSNVKFLDQPIMAISSTMNDRQVIVGTSHGEAGRFDLRNAGKERLLLKYHGYAGGIRNIVACPELPYFVSCGLDRHLYVHNFAKKDPVKKLYMKQQLNCIALTKSFFEESPDKSVETAKVKANDIDDDWANIPPDVLNISNITPLESPSPKKKVRKVADS